jgi:hypothetical protein
MKPKFKNITEQIERMRSLFEEERLYGNLINEQCSSAQEASDYLENLGYIVAQPSSVGARTQRGKLLACLNDPMNVILKNANEQVKHLESATPAARVEITDKPSCSLLITPKVMMGNAIRGTIKADGTVYIYWENGDEVSMVNIGIIKFIGYKGKTTDGITYKDLVYDRCYLPTGQPAPATRQWGKKIFDSSNTNPPCTYGGEPRSGQPTVAFLEELTGIEESGYIKDMGDKIAANNNVSTDACHV